jgi:hypothetical protein
MADDDKMRGKVRVNRARRAADRQILELHSSRRRDPRASDYGLYWLIPKYSALSGRVAEGSLADIERYLDGER